MLVAATARGVCRLAFNEGREALETRFAKAELIEGGADFADLLGMVSRRSKLREISAIFRST